MMMEAVSLTGLCQRPNTPIAFDFKNLAIEE